MILNPFHVVLGQLSHLQNFGDPEENRERYQARHMIAAFHGKTWRNQTTVELLELLATI